MNRQGITGLPPTDDARCGTDAGYQAHRIRGEETCDGCRAAHRVKIKASAERVAARNTAKARAATTAAITAAFGVADPFDPSWRPRAACLDADPEMFFETGRRKRARRRIEKAQAICTGCPVRPQCLAYAVASRTRFGIFGGLTREQRTAGDPDGDNLGRMLTLEEITP